jgi:hypothetical protein
MIVCLYWQASQLMSQSAMFKIKVLLGGRLGTILEPDRSSHPKRKVCNLRPALHHFMLKERIAAYLEDLEFFPALIQQHPHLSLVSLTVVFPKRVLCPSFGVFSEIVGGEAVRIAP